MKFMDTKSPRKYKLPQHYPSLTQTERREVREQYIKEQEGLCSYCGGSLSDSPSDNILSKPLNMRRFPTDFLKHPIHLHHDHGTGLTLGAVHAYCNGVLWEYHGE